MIITQCRPDVDQHCDVDNTDKTSCIGHSSNFLDLSLTCISLREETLLFIFYHTASSDNFTQFFWSLINHRSLVRTIHTCLCRVHIKKAIILSQEINSSSEFKQSSIFRDLYKTIFKVFDLKTSYTGLARSRQQFDLKCIENNTTQ